MHQRTETLDSIVLPNRYERVYGANPNFVAHSDDYSIAVVDVWCSKAQVEVYDFEEIIWCEYVDRDILSKRVCELLVEY